jgi:hypothetical protein
VAFGALRGERLRLAAVRSATSGVQRVWLAGR